MDDRIMRRTAVRILALPVILVLLALPARAAAADRAPLDGGSGSTDHFTLETLHVPDLINTPPGVTVAPLAVTVTEASSTSTFTVVLDAAPSGDVVIDVVSGDTAEATVTPSQLTFTTSNWSTPRQATVTGVDDPVDDGDRTVTIALTMNGGLTADPSYAAIDPADVTATITDDDAAGVRLSTTAVSVAESGTTATFTVVLTSRPAGTILIDVLASQPDEATVAPPRLAFTSSTWSAAQTVTVTGVNDTIHDGDQQSNVSFSVNAPDDPAYSALQIPFVMITTVDDDLSPTTTTLASSPNPSLPGQSVTITATVTSGTAGTITGTVTFYDGTSPLGDAALTGGSAAVTAALSAGNHAITARYGGDANYAAGAWAGLNQVVTPVWPDAPVDLVATAVSDTQVILTWVPVSGCFAYDLFRSTSVGTNFSYVDTPRSQPFLDYWLRPNTTYLYKVRARLSDIRDHSSLSNVDVATTILFTDPVLSGTVPTRAVHLTELRTAVNAMRAAADLAPASFTDSSVPGAVIRRVHLTELRSALDAARSAIGLTALTYTDPALPAGTAIKAVHWSELRNGTK